VTMALSCQTGRIFIIFNAHIPTDQSDISLYARPFIELGHSRAR